MASARARFAIAAGVIVLSIGGLIVWAVSAAPVYYRTPTELLSGQGDPSQRLRVAGKVVPGTITKQSGTTRFAVTDGTSRVDVKTADLLPDTFGPNVEVVAEGAMTKGGLFSASTVLAKCPSKFKAKQTASRR
jgi:cytochrome c-type biogenesis protein CcmE